jgi:hypothetical protein
MLTIFKNKKDKTYWEDSKWANTHFTEIAQNYPGQWVAIVDRKVVAAGHDLKTVISEAENKTGRTDFPVYFAEGKLLCDYQRGRAFLKIR